jgi:protein-export membrane protein SecD
MRKADAWRIALILSLCLISVYVLYPTFKFYRMGIEERQALQAEDPNSYIPLEKKALKLGLDLQGGMHIVLEVDKSNLTADEARDAPERALEIIRNRIDQWGVSEPLIQKQGEDRIVVELPGLEDPERARDLIGSTALLEFRLLPEPEATQKTVLAIDSVLARVEKRKGSALTTKEKEIAPSDTLIPATELFAQEDTSAFPPDEEEASRLFTMLLEPRHDSYAVLVEDVPLISKYLSLPEVKEIVPPGTEFTFSTRTYEIANRKFRDLYHIRKRTELSGKYLTDARPAFDQWQKPVVNFTLTKEGGRIFAALTGANIKKPLAIVLDNRVESAPTIQSKIRDRGQITMGGSATFEDAKELAVVLRAGALPAPVSVIQNSVVGATLGKDSINKGKLSVLVGTCVVLFFMFIYYRLSGVVAGLAMLFNLLFLLASMAGLGATLTMPGIAGIVLIMGMSVDANVLIFERTREELRTGKTVKASIEAGYKRALLTIVDAHVTIMITALFLFIFGTGPIKGFAVSLSLGIVISLFTAYVITKTIFDIRKAYRTLSI